jgi:hypothetical protein
VNEIEVIAPMNVIKDIHDSEAATFDLRSKPVVNDSNAVCFPGAPHFSMMVKPYFTVPAKNCICSIALEA